MLADGAPDIPFFGEETGGQRGELGWICDPLDGTANFLHRFPVVGVSVALVADGVPVVGVVHAPLLDDTYVATRGGGAFRDGRGIAVSDRSPGRAVVATGFPFRHEDLKDRVPRRCSAGQCTASRTCGAPGAASLDLAWTAEGVFDGYFERRLGPWDVAAGALLVREAGGLVTDWGGRRARPGSTPGDIVAGPPAVHAEILRIAADEASSP